MPIGSLISGLFGTFSNQQSIDEQKKENQKAREYNLSLARLQNQWNIDQWNRENVYNSPAAQMQRFAAAGLNPDLIYGQQTTGGQISGSLTSGAPANPANIEGLLASRDANISRMVDSTAQRMANAQIENIKADTQNKRTEGDILKSDASFRDAINQGSVNLVNAQINGIDSNILKNEAEISKFRQECVNLQSANNNLIAEYDKIRAATSNLDADTAYKRIRAVLDSRETEANIRKLAASTRLDMASTRAIVSKLTYELAGLKAEAAKIDVETSVLEKLGMSYDVSTNQMIFNFQQDKEYDSLQRKAGICRDVCIGLLPVAQLVGTAVGTAIAGPKPIRGFGR